MDAAIHAELAELRRRAFGLHPDIEGDPVATARLVDLEQLVLVEHAAAFAAESGGRLPWDAPVGAGTDSRPSPLVVGSMDAERGEAPTFPPDARRGETATFPPDAGRGETATFPPDASAPRRPRARRRDGWAAAAAAAVVATAVVVATPVTPSAPAGGDVTIEPAGSAYSITRDADARVLLEIPFGPWINTTTSAEEVLWLFPTTDEIEWTVPLGEYYGWQIWIGGTDDQPEKQQCLLALHGGVARARCIPAALRPFSALVVTLPYRAIDADERPPGFTPGERIGFWWRSEDAVTVLRAPASTQDRG